MSYTNGRIPRSALAPITIAANGEQAYLIKEAAAAFLAMNAESERRFGVTLRPTSARTAYRPYEDQEYFWDQYLHHGGALAAQPGTSNHGLGLAVDFATEQMRHIVDLIGAKYGWSKAWSDAPSEWWHIKWRPGYYPAIKPIDVMDRLRQEPLKLGSRGHDVHDVQVWLQRGGYISPHAKLKDPGTFGGETRKAVKRFQRHVKIKSDGIVGPQTYAAIARRWSHEGRFNPKYR